MDFLKRLDGVSAYCSFIPFSKNGYTIAKFKITDDKVLNQLPSPYITVKGLYNVKTGDNRFVTGDLTDDEKYPGTYIGSASQFKDIKEVMKNNPLAYLKSITSDIIANALINTLPDPIQSLEDRDVESLMLVDGVGMHVANMLLDKHSDNKDYSFAISKLSKKYGMTNKAIKKMCEQVGDQEKLVNMIEENVYNLVKLGGVGFRKADQYFLNANQHDDFAYKSEQRVKAYIDFMFNEEYNKRNTWLSAKQISLNVLDFIPDADLKYVSEYIKDSDNYVRINTTNGKRFSLKSIFNMELYVAKKIRSMAKESVDVIEDVKSIIKTTEVSQGFKFSDEQLEAINLGINNSIFLLQGPAGTGKSSVAKGIVNILKAQGLSVVGCALSGRAAKNLEDITNNSGKTIHRLLQMGTHYEHNDKNPLEYDVVILDEISMVPLYLYKKLLSSLKPNARLIMLGDNAQLPSISAGVANGLFYSHVVPKYNLQTIHRQAQKSGIITHSLSIRNGYKPQKLELKSDTSNYYGELEDIKYIFVDQNKEDDIVSKSILEYSNMVEEFGLDDVLIITPSRKNMTKLNKYAQMGSNPSDKTKREEKITLSKNSEKVTSENYNIFEDENVYILREGDRVVNVVNNYNTLSPDKQERPIFNGNTGKIISIENESMIIYFDGVGEVVVDNQDYKNIRLGYAVTVHAVQGLTIKGVVLALPFQYMLNTKGLLYTAITRSSKKCTIVTSPKTLMQTIKKDDKISEQTNLKLLLEYKNS